MAPRFETGNDSKYKGEAKKFKDMQPEIHDPVGVLTPRRGQKRTIMCVPKAASCGSIPTLLHL